MAQPRRPQGWSGNTCFFGRNPLCLFARRFPNLFPPLKPETVARRTVEAVQLNRALLLLPWTMHALVILKRYRWGRGKLQAGLLPTTDPGGGGPQAGESAHAIAQSRLLWAQRRGEVARVPGASCP